MSRKCANQTFHHREQLGGHPDALFSARRDGGEAGAGHGNHEAVHGGGCGRWPASRTAAPGRTPGDQASPCPTCLPLVSRHYSECFKKQNTEANNPKQTQQAFSEDTTLSSWGRREVCLWVTHRRTVDRTFPDVPVAASGNARICLPQSPNLRPQATAGPARKAWVSDGPRHELAVIWASTELTLCPVAHASTCSPRGLRQRPCCVRAIAFPHV